MVTGQVHASRRRSLQVNLTHNKAQPTCGLAWCPHQCPRRSAHNVLHDSGQQSHCQAAQVDKTRAAGRLVVTSSSPAVVTQLRDCRGRIMHLRFMKKRRLTFMSNSSSMLSWLKARMQSKRMTSALLIAMDSGSRLLDLKSYCSSWARIQQECVA